MHVITKFVFLTFISLGLLSAVTVCADETYRSAVPGFRTLSLAPIPQSAPPVPGAKQKSTLKFSYYSGGGCEEHFTELSVADVKILKISEKSKEVDVTLEFYDRTKSGKYDPCRAILDMNAEFSEDQIREAVFKFVADRNLFDGFQNTESLKMNLVFASPKISIWN